MDIGKFPPALLEKLLRKTGVTDPRVVLGPGVGEDAAVLDLGETLLVVKSDPITFATERIGWYAVQVNANDIACTGGVPRWFLATLLVPERFTEDQAEELFTQVLDACNDIGVALVGGHSEVTQGIDRPLVAGTMLGEVARDRLVRTGGAQEGDSIVVTKGIAIEGTALLALERAEDLRKAGVSDDTITLSVELLNVMGISVLTDAQTACDTAQIHSMHDVTEGGLITGLREVAAASGLGLAIEEDSVPVLPATKEVCQAIGLDPMGLLASGALLITLPPSDVPSLLSELEKKGIDGWEIGMMLAPEEGLISIGREGEVELPQFSRDELARYFSRPLT
ncbi:MAG: AIR synthase family protein [Chloroflexi bacterium]|nr:AIR synthase family protein [Chloroflexota bacterium]